MDDPFIVSGSHHRNAPIDGEAMAAAAAAVASPTTINAVENTTTGATILSPVRRLTYLHLMLTAVACIAIFSLFSKAYEEGVRETNRSTSFVNSGEAIFSPAAEMNIIVASIAISIPSLFELVLDIVSHRKLQYRLATLQQQSVSGAGAILMPSYRRFQECTKEWIARFLVILANLLPAVMIFTSGVERHGNVAISFGIRNSLSIGATMMFFSEAHDVNGWDFLRSSLLTSAFLLAQLLQMYGHFSPTGNNSVMLISSLVIMYIAVFIAVCTILKFVGMILQEVRDHQGKWRGITREKIFFCYISITDLAWICLKLGMSFGLGTRPGYGMYGPPITSVTIIMIVKCVGLNFLSSIITREDLTNAEFSAVDTKVSVFKNICSPLRVVYAGLDKLMSTNVLETMDDEGLKNLTRIAVACNVAMVTLDDLTKIEQRGPTVAAESAYGSSMIVDGGLSGGLALRSNAAAAGMSHRRLGTEGLMRSSFVHQPTGRGTDPPPHGGDDYGGGDIETGLNISISRGGRSARAAGQRSPIPAFVGGGGGPLLLRRGSSVAGGGAASERQGGDHHDQLAVLLSATNEVHGSSFVPVPIPPNNAELLRRIKRAKMIRGSSNVGREQINHVESVEFQLRQQAIGGIAAGSTLQTSSLTAHHLVQQRRDSSPLRDAGRTNLSLPLELIWPPNGENGGSSVVSDANIKKRRRVVDAADQKNGNELVPRPHHTTALGKKKMANGQGGKNAAAGEDTKDASYRSAGSRISEYSHAYSDVSSLVAPPGGKQVVAVIGREEREDDEDTNYCGTPKHRRQGGAKEADGEDGGKAESDQIDSEGSRRSKEEAETKDCGIAVLVGSPQKFDSDDDHPNGALPLDGIRQARRASVSGGASVDSNYDPYATDGDGSTVADEKNARIRPVMHTPVLLGDYSSVSQTNPALPQQPRYQGQNVDFYNSRGYRDIDEDMKYREELQRLGQQQLMMQGNYGGAGLTGDGNGDGGGESIGGDSYDNDPYDNDESNSYGTNAGNEVIKIPEPKQAAVAMANPVNIIAQHSPAAIMNGRNSALLDMLDSRPTATGLTHRAVQHDRVAELRAAAGTNHGSPLIGQNYSNSVPQQRQQQQQQAPSNGIGIMDRLQQIAYTRSIVASTTAGFKSIFGGGNDMAGAAVAAAIGGGISGMSSHAFSSAVTVPTVDNFGVRVRPDTGGLAAAAASTNHTQHAEFCWRLLTKLHGDLKSTLETYQLLLSSVDTLMIEENLDGLFDYLNVVQMLVSKVDASVKCVTEYLEKAKQAFSLRNNNHSVNESLSDKHSFVSWDMGDLSLASGVARESSTRNSSRVVPI